MERGERDERRSGGLIILTTVSVARIVTFTRSFLFYTHTQGLPWPISAITGQRWDYKTWMSQSPVYRSATDKDNNPAITHPHRALDNSEFPFCFTCMMLDCGRELENQEKTQADTGRTCKRHAGGSPDQGSNLCDPAARGGQW